MQLPFVRWAKQKLGRFVLLAVAVSFAAGEVAAQDAVAPASRFKLYGWIESGVTANPDNPAGRQNFGHLFTDRSNELLLNQAVITAERLSSGVTPFSDQDSSDQFTAGIDVIFTF